MFLSSSSPDVSVRVQALKDLFKASTDLLEENPEFVHDTLLARLREPVAEVSKVALDISTLPVVHSALTGEEIFAALTSVLDSTKLDAKLLDTILPYLAGSFVNSYPEQAGVVLRKVFWGRILAGKNASHEREAAWKALKGSTLEKTHTWIKGVGAAFSSSAEEGSKVNAALVNLIAQNLAALPAAEVDEASSFLVGSLVVEPVERVSDDPSVAGASAQLLSLLVTAQLASKLDKTHRLSFILEVLEALRATERGLDAFTVAQAEVLVDDKGALATLVAQAVYGKPQSPKTLRRVRAAALATAVAAIQPLKHSAWTWLAAPESKEDALETYTTLVQSIYRLAHTGSTAGASTFATTLLQSLFTHLVVGDELAFLASVWSESTTPDQLKAVALKDAKTFVEVLAGGKRKADLQVVVPAIVVALAEKDKKVRVAAVELLESVRKSMPETTAEVYGRDQFYGSTSSECLAPPLRASVRR